MQAVVGVGRPEAIEDAAGPVAAAVLWLRVEAQVVNLAAHVVAHLSAINCSKYLRCGLGLSRARTGSGSAARRAWSHASQVPGGW